MVKISLEKPLKVSYLEPASVSSSAGTNQCFFNQAQGGISGLSLGTELEEELCISHFG